jgi:hypothetical protein
LAQQIQINHALGIGRQKGLPRIAALRHMAGWRRVKPCDVGIDAHRLTGSHSVSLRQPPQLSQSHS